jgi:hypothetical protein
MLIDSSLYGYGNISDSGVGDLHVNPIPNLCSRLMTVFIGNIFSQLQSTKKLAEIIPAMKIVLSFVCTSSDVKRIHYITTISHYTLYT